MSTYWGYKCLDCNKETDTYFNHGQDRLNEYFEIRQIIKASGKEFGWIEVHIMGGDYAMGELAGFLDEHEGHRIVLHNEYNEDEELRASRETA